MSGSFNPPAFPCEAQGDRSVPTDHDYLQTGIYSAKFPGMSLRDWFAGQALAGMCANNDLQAQGNYDAVACDCYLFADALLAERAKARP